MPHPSRVDPDPHWTVDKESTTGDPLVTLSEAKQWLRTLSSEEDDLITMLRDAATEDVEDLFGRATVKGLYRLRFHDLIPREHHIQLPRPPLVEVKAVQEYDEDTATWSDLDTSTYEVLHNGNDTPSVVVPAQGETWPLEPLRVNYDAGYDPADAPNDLKRAIHELIAYHYEHRGDDEDVAERPDISDRYSTLKVIWQ